MDSSAGPSVFPNLLMRGISYKALLLVMLQVDNLSKHVHEFGLVKRIDLVIVSPLLRTLQTAVGVFGGEGYTDRMDTVPLMVANAGNSGHAAISSLNCPPIVAVELCREHLIGSSEDTWWKADIRETKEKVMAWGLKVLNWFKVCFMLLLVSTTGPRGVRSEDIGNPLIPGSTAMDFLLRNKNLRGLSERRQMVATEAAAMNDNFNYHNFPHGNSRPNSPASKRANPYRRPCNTGNYCRQGKKGKKSDQRP